MYVPQTVLSNLHSELEGLVVGRRQLAPYVLGDGGRDLDARLLDENRFLNATGYFGECRTEIGVFYLAFKVAASGLVRPVGAVVLAVAKAVDEHCLRGTGQATMRISY